MVAFLSDDSIAVAAQPGASGASFTLSIAKFEWRDGTRRVGAETELPLDAPTVGELFTAAHGGLLLTKTRPTRFVSGDLKSAIKLPINIPIAPMQQANAVAEYKGKSWTLYKLLPKFQAIRDGSGEILTLSDEFVVFRTDRELRIETLAGELRGHFSIAPQSKCLTSAKILSAGRLFLCTCGEFRVVDFSGRQLAKIPAPDGWGPAYRTSLDGSRLLFDHYTRRISAAQRLSDAIERVITLGYGPIVTEQGEDIRVVDTLKGKVCFDLDSPNHLLGENTSQHADISPSGRFAAVVTTTASGSTLSIYGIPATCAIEGVVQAAIIR